MASTASGCFKNHCLGSTGSPASALVQKSPTVGTSSAAKLICGGFDAGKAEIIEFFTSAKIPCWLSEVKAEGYKEAEGHREATEASGEGCVGRGMQRGLAAGTDDTPSLPFREWRMTSAKYDCLSPGL